MSLEWLEHITSLHNVERQEFPQTPTVKENNMSLENDDEVDALIHGVYLAEQIADRVLGPRCSIGRFHSNESIQRSILGGMFIPYFFLWRAATIL